MSLLLLLSNTSVSSAIAVETAYTGGGGYAWSGDDTPDYDLFVLQQNQAIIQVMTALVASGRL